MSDVFRYVSSLELSSFRSDISAFGGRSAPEHTVKVIAPFAAEDHLSFNTQSSSQWDGLRHFGLRSTGQFYNGYISSEFEDSDCLGVHRRLAQFPAADLYFIAEILPRTVDWCARGGIVGRGVLVDWFAWASIRDPHVAMNTGYGIKLEEILAVLSHQNTRICKGDVLFIRTGWTQWYLSEDPCLRHDHMCIQHAPGSHSFIGVAAEEAFVEWLWNSQIAAAASDSVAFEATPPSSEGFGWLHEHLLAGLGCPIGELFDLEKLSVACAQLGRWSFFLSSNPLYLRGGVASPSNAIAIL